jgi:hypothetical protein
LEQSTAESGYSSWPTPRTVTGGPESAERKQELGRTESGGGDLQAASLNWSTPRASDGEKGGPNMSFSAGGVPLPTQAAHWPTPDTMNHRDGTKLRQITVEAAERGSSRGVSLHHAIAHWPTPMAGSPGTDTYNQAGNSDFSRKAMELATSPSLQA